MTAILYHKDARNMKEIEDETIHLVVTSPPYPMIKMWDNMFSNFDELIGEIIKVVDTKKYNPENEELVKEVLSSETCLGGSV